MNALRSGETLGVASPSPAPTGQAVGTLSGLFVYPVKSLGGVAAERWPVTTNGLLYDRRWMVVDEEGRQLTQRGLPRMCLVRPSLSPPPGADDYHADGRHDPVVLELSAPEAGSVEIGSDEPGRLVKVRVWDDEVDAVAAGGPVDAWLSEFLGVKARLVRFEHTPQVPGRAWQRVSFPDSLPFLLIGSSSLDDLNRRLRERGRPEVEMNRFRPNLVVSGSEAFAEDGWLEVSVGPLRFTVTRPCGRCVITTIEQATARTGREPLTTLARYRTSDGKVMFGQKLIHQAHGTLSVGDEVKLYQPLPAERRLRFEQR